MQSLHKKEYLMHMFTGDLVKLNESQFKCIIQASFSDPTGYFLVLNLSMPGPFLNPDIQGMKLLCEVTDQSVN